MRKLHRKTKQEDSEALAVSLQTCCAFSNSALIEDGICCGSNEFYYRVAEHYVELEGLEGEPTKRYCEDLEKMAKVLEALAEQFRTFAENVRQEEGITSHIRSKKEKPEDNGEGTIQI